MAATTITPEAAREIAMAINALAKSCEITIDNLDSTVNGLSNSWEGLAQEGFVSTYRGSASRARDVIQELIWLSNTLFTAAQTYVDADHIDFDLNLNGAQSSMMINGTTYTLQEGSYPS